ncbi:SCO family protein [Streptomyces gobiensis]|uniref:SCO family protein n=1 Tax=Streptomyces gobiensis TaxID=2875706 RepID=UPI001E34345A|nr:SCO family protein [Streptomyces gobiensis]UGY93634.1 SCO family protein [Streptomyces gobiensis]
MRKPTLFVAALTAVAALTLTACGAGTEEVPLFSTDATAGPDKPATVLDQPFSKPDLVLTDTHGKKFDLRAETEDRLTLLYFGYTHCPDACPLTVSNLAIAYQGLSKAEQDKLRVVFVTTDPERDTPQELGTWLPSAGDSDFIGLSGDFSAIQAAARSVGIGIEEPTKDKEGNVVSAHGKTVLAFSPKDNKAHVIYSGGETTADHYAKDLPKLLKGQVP